MQYTIRDLAFTVTIIVILLGFYLHALSIRRETDAFKQAARHEMMNLEFEMRYADFTSSFENSPFQCAISNFYFTRNSSSKGTYSFNCDVKRRDGQPIKGREFRDLLHPISNAGCYRIDTHKHWTVYTDWELESTIDTMEKASWDVQIDVEYSFHEDFPLPTSNYRGIAK